MPKRTKRSNLSTVDNPSGGGDADHLLTQENVHSASPTDRAAEQEEIDMIRKVRQESETGGYVRIWRRIDGSMEYAVVTKVDINNYSPEWLQQVYGGGFYRTRFCTSNHTIVGQRQLIIDPSIPYRNPQAAAAAAEAEKLALAAKPQPSGPDIASIIKELNATKQVGDGGMQMMMTLITAILDSQSKQMTAILSKQGGGSEGVNTVLLEMLRIERERSKEKTPISELLESFHAFKKIQGGGRASDDDDGEEPSMWEKAGKALAPVGSAFAEALMMKFGGGEEMQAGRRMITGGEPAPQTAPPELQPGAEAAATGQTAGMAPVIPINKPRPNVPPMNMLVQMKVNSLLAAAIAAAKASADPAAFAADVIDEIPAKYHETVEGMIKAPDWFEKMFGKPDGQGGHVIAPDALLCKDWLTKMRDALLAGLLEILGPAEEETAKP